MAVKLKKSGKGQGFKEFQASYAFIIGINDYGKGIPPLRSAANDAHKLATLLADKHGYVTHLLTEEVTRDRLTHLFSEVMPARVGANDRALLYFAGHGVALDGQDGPEGYLLPQDASPEDSATFLPMQDVQRSLEALPCRHLLVILDCCFAGAFRWASTRDVARFPSVIHQELYERFLREPAWQVLTSTAYDQKALDTVAGQVIGVREGTAEAAAAAHSPFALALFDALEGAADVVPRDGGDGIITATELFLFLRDQVERGVAHYHNQTPGLWPLRREYDKGEYVFLDPKGTLNLPPAPELTFDLNPWRGLKSYDQKHSKLFFGREQEIQELFARVSGQPFTAVLGASGTGKSSLVKAGLLPHLEREGQGKNGAEGDEGEWFILPPLRPGATPLLNLRRHLAAHLTDRTDGAKLAHLGDDPQALADLIALWHQTNPDCKLLLVVDQLEELVTLCQEEPRRHFLTLLAQALKQQPDAFRLIITLRTDFEPQFDVHTPLASFWRAARYVVPPMDQADLRQIIEGPAAVRVLYFESSELVDGLITEVIQTPGALPLLSFTLSELYIRYLRSGRDNRALALEDYEALGGVIGSLRNRANEEYEALPDDAHRETKRRVMLRMISVEGGELARRRVQRSELVYPDERENRRVDAVLDRLVRARLLVTGQEEGEATVEPAHDALVLAWDNLLRWKKEAEEYLPLQRRLAQAATEWTKARPEARSGLLWDDDPRLPQLEETLWPTGGKQQGFRGRLRWARQVLAPNTGAPPDTRWLNGAELVFVQASVRARARFWRRVTSITAAVLIVLTALTAFALVQQNRAVNEADRAVRAQTSAEQRERIALSRQAAAQSLVALDRERDLALLLANQASQITDTLEARGSLLTALLHRPAIAVFVNEYRTPVISLAFSPDGGTLAAVNQEGGALLWDVARRRPLRGSVDLPAPPVQVAFSPGGTILQAASEDGDIMSWDIANRQVRAQSTTDHLNHPTSQRWSPVFSLDGSVLAAGGSGPAVVLWDTLTGEPTGTSFIEPPPDAVTAAAVSAQGRLVAVGLEYGYGYLWDAETAERIDDRSGLYHDDEVDVTALAFDPQDRLVASGALNGSVHLTGITDPSLNRALIPELSASVTALAFGPEGELLASADEEGGILLWSIDDEETTGSPLSGHTASALSLAFSPDGRLLASGHQNGQIVLWDLQPYPLGEEIIGAEESWDSLAVSPDGRTLVAAGDSSGILLWDLEAQEKIGSLSFKPTKVVTETSVHLSGFTQESTPSVSEADQPPALSIEPKLDSGPRAVLAGWAPGLAFHPDGRMLASASEHQVILWDVASREPTALLKTANPITDLAFGPVSTQFEQGVLAVAGPVPAVTFWDLATLEPRQAQISANGLCLGGVQRLAFRPGGTALASVFDGAGDVSVVLWSLRSETPGGDLVFTDCRPIAKSLPPFGVDAQAVAFSPDGQTLAAGSFQGDLKLWSLSDDLVGGSAELRLDADATSILFDPGGFWLATATSNREVVLWDAQTLQPVGEPIPLRHGKVRKMLFSPDGRLLLALTDQGKILVWPMDLASWQAQACEIAGRNLSPEEWATYFPDDTYQPTCPQDGSP